MICPPCATTADGLRQYAISHGMPDADISHRPDICRDHALQPHGCTCQHGQRGTERNEAEQ